MAWPSVRHKTAVAGGTWTPADMNAVQDQYLRPAGIVAGDLGDVGQQAYIKAGIPQETDLAVTPGTGLALNVAAGRVWISNTAAGPVIQHIRPATGTVTHTTAHATLPRIDQVYAQYNGGGAPTIGITAGVPTSGATLANRNGAGVMAENYQLLYDVLVPAAFAGPFVAATHLRDRRPWARGEMQFTLTSASTFAVYSDLDGNVDWGYDIEVSGSIGAGASGNQYPRLLPNGDSVGHRTYRQYHEGTAGTVNSIDFGDSLGLALGMGYLTAYTIHSKTTFQVKELTAGANRCSSAVGASFRDSDSYGYNFRLATRWSTVGTQVTFLSVDFGAAFTGLLTVRKHKKF